MNAWADQKPLKPTDGPIVFKSTMEYSETDITGDIKEITRTFDTSGTALHEVAGSKCKNEMLRLFTG